MSMHTGVRSLVLCTSSSGTAYHRFKGADASFQIHDIVGFANAIGAVVGADECIVGPCDYSPDAKARVHQEQGPALQAGGFPIITLRNGMQFSPAFIALPEGIEDDTQFAKHARFADDEEFRLVWRIKDAVGEEPQLFDIPAAREFCRFT